MCNSHQWPSAIRTRLTYSLGRRAELFEFLQVAFQTPSRKDKQMRALEIAAALILAAVAFIAVKLIGLVLHVALIAAVIGLIVGFAVARAFRQT